MNWHLANLYEYAFNRGRFGVGKRVHAPISANVYRKHRLVFNRIHYDHSIDRSIYKVDDRLLGGVSPMLSARTISFFANRRICVIGGDARRQDTSRRLSADMCQRKRRPCAKHSRVEIWGSKNSNFDHITTILATTIRIRIFIENSR